MIENPRARSGGARAWLLLAATIVLEVMASLSLRGAIEHPWLYALVVIGYAGSFGMLALVLRAGMPLGVAYGIWGALGVVLTALFGAIVFGEVISPVMVVGIGMVVAGVLVVELGSQQAARREHARTATTARTDVHP